MAARFPTCRKLPVAAADECAYTEVNKSSLSIVHNPWTNRWKAQLGDRPRNKSWGIRLAAKPFQVPFSDRKTNRTCLFRSRAFAQFFLVNCFADVGIALERMLP